MWLGDVAIGMGYAWATHGLRMGYAWATHGLRMGYAWWLGMVARHGG